MFKIFIPSLIHIIITYLLNLYGIQLFPESIIIVYFITSLFFLNVKKDFFVIFLIGYIIRIMLMYFDIYFNDVFVLPHTGDANSFYEAGKIYFNYGSIFLSDIYGGLYSKFLGFIMLLTGENRLILQHLNIIFDIGSIIILIRCLQFLDIKNKIIKIITLIYTFMPMHMIIASVLMRESIIVYLISLSLINIINYYKNNKTKYLVEAFTFIILGSLFHSAVIFLGIGYLYIILFNKSNINFKKTLNILILLFLLISIVYINRDIIFKKLLIDGEVNISYGNYKGADSIYLPQLKINNIREAIIYSPIRGLYFLISPTPFYWRGIVDVLSFMLDSSIYIIFIMESIRVLKNREIVLNNKVIVLGLLLSIFVFTIIFGLGVNNSGTAIRHRNKILILVLTFIACVYNDRLLS